LIIHYLFKFYDSSSLNVISQPTASNNKLGRIITKYFSEY